MVSSCADIWENWMPRLYIRLDWDVGDRTSKS